MQFFDVIIFFKLRTIQQKTVKPTYFCPLGARKLVEGKGHETHEGLKQSLKNRDATVFLMPVNVAEQHVTTTTTEFLCPYCARLCASRVGLQSHLRAHRWDHDKIAFFGHWRTTRSHSLTRKQSEYCYLPIAILAVWFEQLVYLQRWCGLISGQKVDISGKAARRRESLY